MKPIEFKEQNVVFAKDQPEYQPLPAFTYPDGVVVCCWEMSKEEIEEVAKTGKIWVSLSTFKQPLMPMYLTTKKEELILKNEDNEG